MSCTTSLVLWFALLRPLLRENDREREATRRRQQELEANAARQEFEARFHRAVEMCGTEERVFAVTAKALRTLGPGRDAALLLADSSDAHLKALVELVPGGDAHCPAASPHDCPAIRQAQTLDFPDSDALDACPHMDERGCGRFSAACVPVNIAGRAIGVLHLVAEPERGPTRAERQRAEAIAAEIGSRIGMLRVMSATTLQAATDPLTGLLNRRSFENQAQHLVHRQTTFGLAVADLDHFKRLNDTNGHDTGDRALRVFSRTLQRVLRADDLICRYGGEEFVIAFPDCTIEQTVAALERVQAELVIAIASGSVPGFTASYGVAHSDEAAGLEALVRIADANLFRAKREGRDRVVAQAVG